VDIIDDWSCLARSKDEREIVREVFRMDRDLVLGVRCGCGRRRAPTRAVSKERVNNATEDRETNDSDDNRNGDLGTSAERRRAIVNRVARMAARSVGRVRTSLQRGVKWVGGIVRNVHRGESEERCVIIDGDLRRGLCELRVTNDAKRNRTSVWGQSSRRS